MHETVYERQCAKTIGTQWFLKGLEAPKRLQDGSKAACTCFETNGLPIALVQFRSCSRLRSSMMNGTGLKPTCTKITGQQ